ncbi:MAG: DUF1573 domain-containing protein [Bacteroidales bacterium]|nr:DUF1573 domain-containing protein [Bacteroidales bacterium]
MKRILAIGLIVVSVCGLSCSRTKMLQKHATKAHIAFKDVRHDFGKVIFGQPADFDFVFTNTGVDTLIINEVQSTCGCTIPTWSQEPVAPGAKGVISVSYDTRRSGEFEKGITVFSNADNSAMLLVISGFVTPNPHKEILGGNKSNKITKDTIPDTVEEMGK